MRLSSDPLPFFLIHLPSHLSAIMFTHLQLAERYESNRKGQSNIWELKKLCIANDSMVGGWNGQSPGKRWKNCILNQQSERAEAAPQGRLMITTLLLKGLIILRLPSERHFSGLNPPQSFVNCFIVFLIHCPVFSVIIVLFAMTGFHFKDHFSCYYAVIFSSLFYS